MRYSQTIGEQRTVQKPILSTFPIRPSRRRRDRRSAPGQDDEGVLSRDSPYDPRAELRHVRNRAHEGAYRHVRRKYDPGCKRTDLYPPPSKHVHQHALGEHCEDALHVDNRRDLRVLP